jgi:hypothetical protein
MNWRSTTAVLLVLGAGCAPGAYNVGTLDSPAASEYCHRKIQPPGPTDPARPTQSRAGDYIDYYGPCDGPSRRDSALQQQRFEQFRFGRDYIDE